MSENPAEFATPQLVERPEQHLAVVRERVAFDEIPGLYDRAFPLLFSTLAAHGIQPAGAPYGVIFGEPGDTLDLAVSVPLTAPLAITATALETPASGTVSPETLPAGRVATLLVRGDYALIADGYSHLYAWLAAEGLTPIGIAWEQYLTEPAPGGDPAANETLLGVHLA